MALAVALESKEFDLLIAYHEREAALAHEKGNELQAHLHERRAFELRKATAPKWS